MPTVRSSASPWVEAAPFRAHLRHVMAVGDMSVEVVAELTGIPPRAARHLLEGRAGRPVRRISADTARRLLRVTSADARTVGCRLVSARITLARLQELMAAGHGVSDLARQLSIDSDTLHELADGRRDTCSQLVAARVGAVHAARDARDDLIYSLAS